MTDEGKRARGRLIDAYGDADRTLDVNPDALALPSPRVRQELSSAGIDEYLQGIGGDVDGTLTSTGLRIPTEPWRAPSGGDSPDIGVGRYFFQLATEKVANGRRVRVRGVRQYLSIGSAVPVAGGAPYVLEQQVTSPMWRFSDGNVEWFLSIVKPRPKDPLLATDAQSFAHRYSDTSGPGALLYESFVAPPAHLLPTGAPDFYEFITSYVPPAFPPHDPLGGALGAVRDIRFPWTDDQAWDSLDVEVVGPCSIVMFASVRQTDPSTRAPLPAGYIPPASQPEEQFIAAIEHTITDPPAGVVYWRIAGALILEDVQ